MYKKIFTPVVPLCLLLASSCAVYDTRPTNWEFALPAGQQSELKLHFETVGQGEPVILIHGFAANNYTWRYLVPELSKTHKLFLLDLKGFGQSPKPNDSAYSIVDQARLVLNVIGENKLGNVAIVGHSYGGGVALICALLLEKNNPGRLQRLVLIDSVAYRQQIPLFIELLATPFLGSFVANTFSVDFQVKNVLAKAYYNDQLITDTTVEAYAQPLKQENAIEALVATARSIIPGDIDEISKAYPRIRAPTRLIWGDKDEIVPLDIGRQLNAAIAASSLVVLEDCGHIPQEECPQKTVPAILEFLND